MAHILDQVVDGSVPAPEYAEALGLPQPAGWEPGRVWAVWDVDPVRLTPWGAVFGGYLAALADHFAGLAALSVLEPDETFGTNDLRLSPLRAVRAGSVDIQAKVLHRGRSTVHVEVEFRSADGELAAKASAVQVLARP